ncbi:amino acid ABC transporter ATP-binding protein [Rhodococcus sp. ACPA1]|uniref:amino acid ABC transporter ATP-binding protein n=1 Tax=Rhodococcus sp. ACPA1 TaxID=2028572 RepID=UPI000BB11403|nr:amino acid ABC transporter ATP-binding protein [Rhodococcus sp. ACPA1]PBC51507.1 glutamine ABC transporter ATP-binding protein [Rhodococcus sp. ACPA1]
MTSTTEHGAAIAMSQITKVFGSRTVLDHADLVVAPGEVISLIGPSGSGKSTLLRCMNLLERPTSGSIDVLGQRIVDNGECPLGRRDLRRMRMRVGMVFQSYNLFPNMTALQNVSFAQARSLGRSKAEGDERADTLLRRVGLGAVVGNLPSQLSGGQQQRVAIARSLAMDPQVMLFDEPTSAIDPELRIEVLEVMKDLAEGGMTMVVVTHELRFAERVASKVAFLADGRIVESGPSEQIFRAPTHGRTARFIAAISETEL